MAPRSMKTEEDGASPKSPKSLRVRSPPGSPSGKSGSSGKCGWSTSGSRRGSSGKGSPPSGARIRRGGIAWGWPQSFLLRAVLAKYATFRDSKRLQRQLFRSPPLPSRVVHPGTCGGSRPRPYLGSRGFLPGSTTKQEGSGRRSKRAADLARRAYVPPQPRNAHADAPQAPLGIGEGQYLPEAIDLNTQLHQTYGHMVEIYILIDQECSMKTNLKRIAERTSWKHIRELVHAKDCTIQNLLNTYRTLEVMEADLRGRIWKLNAIPYDRPLRLLNHPEQLDG